jgi:hypothetical protein
VSRPSRFTLPANNRERLRNEQRQAAPLSQLYPQLSEVHVEFAFEDGTDSPPSLQNYSHFPAARSLFRYPCPCHSCDGEFDLASYIANLAGSTKRTPRVQRFTVVCPGQRLEAQQQRSACPIRATISISATAHTGERK